MPQPQQPPRRKEPGLIGKLLSGTLRFISWLIVSLIISIAIEWIGMVYVWPDQKSNHAKSVFLQDQGYLNAQLKDQSIAVKGKAIRLTHQTVEHIARQSWLKSLVKKQPNREGSLLKLRTWTDRLYRRYQPYIQATGYVSQTFVIRLTLLLFSLPIFVIAAVVGAMDGLVERDLRRWGGGRESSHVFNLARRSVFPAFVSACIVYISLPFSLNPVLVILPFAVLMGLTTRIAFERLKKYF